MKGIKQIVVFLLLAMLLTMIPTGVIIASAEEVDSGYCGDNAFWQITDDVLTISGTGAIYHYSFIGDNIPDYAVYASTIKKIVIEEGITEIGNEAFESLAHYDENHVYSNLSEIVLPSTLTKIGANAFAGSTSIEVINLPANVSTFGIQVFSGCTALKEINVAAGNTAFTSMEGVLFTADGSGLITYPIGRTAEEYTIPASVTRIWECAFLCAENLKKVTFNNGLEIIADGAFNSCSNLNEVYLPSTVKVIGGDVFQCCTSLADFTIPSTIESIGARSFDDTAYYNDYDNWSDGVLYHKNILISARYLFEDIENDDFIMNIFEGHCTVLPGTTLIVNEAFFLTDVASVSLPETMKYIGDGAFYCTGLAEISIPDAVEYIGEEAFRSCSDLATVILGNNITHIGSGAFNETAYSQNSANYTDGLLCNGKYLLDFQTDLTGEVVIPEGITLLADGAFFYESGVIRENQGSQISSVKFPSTLTAISAKAFHDCKNLKQLQIPDTITEIGEYAFGYSYSYDHSEQKTKYLPRTDCSIVCGKNSAAQQYAKDNNISYSYFAESIKLSEPEYTLYVNKNMTYQLTTSFLPEGSAVEAVTYQSSDEEIATVNADGLVSVHDKAGTVEITATTASGFNDTIALEIFGVSVIEAETPQLIYFRSTNDVQYFRFKSGNAGIYNFNYLTKSVATTLYTVSGNVIYADVPAGSFSPNLPANTFFELRLQCNPFVEEEVLTIVPPASSEGEVGGEEDGKRLTSKDIDFVETHPIKMFENTYGDWQTYYDEETGEKTSYYCYNWSQFVGYTITLKNGDVIEAPEGYFSYDGIYYAGASFHSHKSYEERWLAGNTYTEKTTILGEEYDVSITIAKPPIKSIRCSVDEITLLEGTYCDILSPSTSSVQLYAYRWYEAVDWIVEFQDGHEVTAFNGVVKIEDRHYKFDFTDTQGTLQSWTPGNTYTAHAKFMGLECDIDVTISSSIIKDIVFKDIHVYENADGYYSSGYTIYDERFEWFKYNWKQFIDYDVTFVDGIYVEDWGDGFYYDGKHYGIEISDTQTPYTPWVTGVTYDVKLAVFGKEYAAKVSVLPNPVEEITFESMVIPQGYGSTDTEYDALLNQEFTYFRYNDNAFAYSVRFKDGSYIPGATDAIKYDGRVYSPMIVGGVQTHNNIWEPGNAYQITVSVMGVETVVPVYIQPIPAADGFGYYYNYRDNISITECSKTDSKLVIPAEIGEHAVTEIFSLDLAEDLVEELVLPKTISDLGRFDFTSMQNLKTIYYAGSSYQWDDISHFYRGYGDIEIVFNYQMEQPQAVQPVCQTIGINSVVLTAMDGCEYSIDGINWQESNVFTELSPATEYTFYQRYAATSGLAAGEMSVGLTVKTQCPHQYTNACDKTCNICGATRTVPAHQYSNKCDKSCNVCGKTRSVGSHKYSNSCDTTCNYCNAKRTIKHTYSNACDTKCNVCSATRTITHTYSNKCDKSCNVCGKTRTVGAHKYSNNCDTTCNYCNAKRTIKHTYSNACDTKCNVCSATRTITHTYSNKCDKSCNICGKTRTVGAHKYSDSCDTACNYCNAKRTIKHTYSNTCDTRCNVCSATRTITHTYSNKCDKSCNVCGKTRTVGAHKYSNKCDTSCNVCKATRSITHTYKTTTTKATLAKNGNIVKKCTVCGKTSKATIRYAKTFRLSTTSYTYDGKVKTPTVTVKDSAGKTLKKNTDYTVTYASGRKNVGTYKVTIKMKGNYTGTKTLTFKIVPKAASINKLTAKTKALTVKLNRSLQQSTGYQIQYATNKNFTGAKAKVLSDYKTSNTTLTGLKAKTTYYVRVRTYKKIGSTTYYSSWSSYKYLKTK